jgi:hypothetical protein
MSNTNSNNNVSRGAGCFGWIGGVSAAVCSYALNKSLLWALLHSIFGWLYLLYLLLGFGGGVPSIAF